ncbi:MAG: DUF2520 domain-containing protein, partial [Acidimicrobiales bacterium]
LIASACGSDWLAMVHTLRVIGPGRAGRSLALALERAGWRVDGMLGRPHDVSHAAEAVDLLVLAVPDAAVPDVAAQVEPVGATVVAHLAGSLGLDVLASHPRRASIHPLIAMPNPEVGAARLASGAWFAVAGDPLAQRVVDALGGRAIDVRDEHRAAYHAAAVIASNHLVALLAQAERVAATADVPLAAYLDLVLATVDNVADLGPARALTGPAARGDNATIERHVETLDPAERPLYLLLAEECRRLAGAGR